MVGISQVQLGTLYTINGLLVVALQIPVTRFLGRYSLSAQMALGGFIYAVGYGMVGTLVGYEWFIMAIVIVTLGEISMSPPSLTLLSRLAPDGRMGRYMGIYGIFMAAGWSLGPVYGGLLLDMFGENPTLAWVLISSLAALSGLGYLFSRRAFGKAADPQTADVSE
jgi:MFS family permease